MTFNIFYFLAVGFMATALLNVLSFVSYIATFYLLFYIIILCDCIEC